jgi:hypothetical protein
LRFENYHSIKSSKSNLEISYEMDNNWGGINEINAKVYGENIGKI